MIKCYDLLLNISDIQYKKAIKNSTAYVLYIFVQGYILCKALKYCSGGGMATVEKMKNEGAGIKL